MYVHIPIKNEMSYLFLLDKIILIIDTPMKSRLRKKICIFNTIQMGASFHPPYPSNTLSNLGLQIRLFGDFSSNRNNHKWYT